MDSRSTSASNLGDGTSQTIQTLLDINAMIDIHAKHLEGLRTQCSTSAELIQQEIRTIEVALLMNYHILPLTCYDFPGETSQAVQQTTSGKGQTTFR